MNINVTILADNTAGRGPLRGESGLSILIESGSRNYLFDTGLSKLFSLNARLLNLELFGVDDIILSHGHYDHADGLPWAFAQSPRAQLISGRGAIKKRFSSSTGKMHYVGISEKALDCIKQADIEGRVTWADAKPLYFPDAVIFSTGGRKELPEDWNFFAKSAEGDLIPDRFEDEISLLINGENSAMLFVGCSHCTLPSIVAKAETLTDKPIHYILGGSHLNKVSDEEIMRTAEFFRQREDCQLYLGHCTGINGFSRLYHALDGKNLISFHSGWARKFHLN
jgi:7,8-dihydropterin-6-yl-methyl-4-(beta-D-ribofuranosyl)aminobenzene 5'-phosphate synthase